MGGKKPILFRAAVPELLRSKILVFAMWNPCKVNVGNMYMNVGIIHVHV